MKKNLIGTLIVVFMVVLIECLVYFLFINVEKDYDKTKAKKLVDKYFTDNYVVIGNIIKDGITDRYKIGLAIDNTDNKLTEYECSELYPDKEKDDSGIIVGNGTFCDEKVNTISYKDLNDSYKKLFGNDLKLKKESYGIYDYIEDKDMFVLLSCRCDGGGATRYLYDVKEAKIKGNNLSVKIYYFEYTPEEGKESEEIDEAKILKDNKKKATIYELKFKKEDKVFKLRSVKKVS